MALHISVLYLFPLPLCPSWLLNDNNQSTKTNSCNTLQVSTDRCCENRSKDLWPNWNVVSQMSTNVVAQISSVTVDSLSFVITSPLTILSLNLSFSKYIRSFNDKFIWHLSCSSFFWFFYVIWILFIAYFFILFRIHFSLQLCSTQKINKSETFKTY